eukprot:1152055-Pelagomonas_calceolata.AAC.2
MPSSYLLSTTEICILDAAADPNQKPVEQTFSHIHLLGMKYCEDMRPGAQLEASQQQCNELCQQLQGAETTLHTILLGVGGTIHTAHTRDQI